MWAIVGQYQYHRAFSEIPRRWCLLMALADSLYCFAYDDYGEGPTRLPSSPMPTAD